ncbi:filamentous hemagglutinin N-terminal domain-containing protein [Saccharospirillum mangrovi]|uniref:two-partner secretion domain-containing protein n=1 Tax=Saccharospirillum mangrovi TaxID=2161747 RepID=UPI000D385B83|nr:filamentous hemagglutinin N-terminal domain-containing protein [Saccharospirillum mangrovi]
MPGISNRPKFAYKALAAAILAATAAIGRASPVGGQVTAGDGSIAQPDANTTNVQQNSDQLVIEWQGFDVDTDESVNFFQPSSSSVVLNQILNGSVSVIQGQINANGQVILVNPNGVYFSSTAQLSVGSLVASGHAISTEDFLNGDWVFEREDGTDGSVVNHGTIQAANGGSVTLLGSRVENTGYIIAHAGRINLAVGDRIALDFDGDGLMRFTIDEKLLANLSGADSAILNSGELLANGGTIVLEGRVAQDIFSQVVNNEGIIKAGRIENNGGVISLVGSGGANSSVVNTGQIDASALDADSDGGNITLHAEDSTLLVEDGSQILASSSGQQGGQVHLLGDQIALTGEVSVDASGELGGGEILIGGDYQGKNADIPNAQKVIVGSQVNLNADAKRLGDGGRIIVWADDWTRFGGNLSARGGAEGGDGGFAEVSGKQNLAFYGLADLSAAFGKFGVLLLDPTNINIVAGAGSDDIELTNSGDVLFGDGAGDFEIGTDTINTQTANVVLQASNDITQAIGADINIANAGTSITLQAGNDIELNAGITTNGGNITLQADSDDNNSGSLSVSTAGLTSVGGNIDLSGHMITTAGTIDASGGAGAGTVIMAAGGGISLGADVTSGGAQTYSNAVALSDSLTLQGSTIHFGGLVAGNSNGLDINGDLDLDGTLSGVADLSVSGASDLSANVSTTGTQTYTGAVTLSSDVTLTTTDDQISFASAINGDSDGGNGKESLTLSAGTGPVIFGNAVGSTDSLEFLNITGTGSTQLTGNVTTEGAQTYGGAVTLNADVTLQTTDSDITFSATVDGDSDSGDGEESLTLTTGTGAVIFGDAVGGTDSLESLSVTSATAATELGGNVTTDGAQTYAGAVVLNADVTLQTTDSDITFSATVDGDSDSGDGEESLTLTTGTGAVTFSGAVGGTDSLQFLDITSATGSVNLGADVSTEGAQTYGGAVTLTNNVALNADEDDILFSSSISGSTHALTIDAGSGIGTVTFGDDASGVEDESVTVGSLSVTASSIALNDNVTTDNNGTGTQTYTGAVTLNQGVELQTDDSNITFTSTVNGNGAGGKESLTLTTGTGTSIFQGEVGGSDSLASLTVNNAASIGANINTDGAQTYSGTVTLTNDVTLDADDDDILFAANVSGSGHALTVDAGAASGSVTFGDDASGVDDESVSVGSLAVTANAITLNDNVSTDTDATGSQTYTGAVTLNQDVSLQTTNSDITFSNTINGNSAGDKESLTLTTGTGTSIFQGIVGGSDSLASLTVNNAASLGADISTDGTQTYSGAVTLTNGVALSAADDDITFASTVDGDSAGGKESLTLTTGTGTAIFQGIVGGGDSLASLTVNNAASLGANISTEGAQTYNAAVTLTNNVTLDANDDDILFASAVSDGGNSHTLTVDAGETSGSVTFGNDASGVEDESVSVAALSVTANAIALNDNVTTAGAQSYTGAVTLNQDVALNTTNSNIGVVGSINSEASEENTLTLNAGSGTVTLNGAVGTGTNGALGSLTVSDSNTATVLGGNVTTTGAQSYAGTVTLAETVALTTTNSAISFDNAINSEASEANALTLNAGTGAVTLGNVGLGANGALGSLDINAAGGSIDLGGNITTTGTQQYTGAVTLSENVTLNTTDSAVGFDNSVDSEASAAHTLTVNAGTGTVTLSGVVGGGVDGELGGLTITGADGAIVLGGNVTTSGDQLYAGDVTLNDNLTLTTTSASAGDIDFGGTVNGFTGDADSESLTLVADGDVSFADVVGGTEMGGLDVTANAIDLGGNVTTSGNQHYVGEVNLTSNLTLATNNNSDIHFEDTLNGAHSLTLSAGTGVVSFDDTVGGTATLTSLSINSGNSTINIGGNVSTTNSQLYSGAVTLTNNATFSSSNGNITFNNTVSGDDGSQSLTLSNASGTAIFADAISNLASVTANHAVSLAGDVTTSGNQSYVGAVTLNDDVTLETTSNGSVTFSGAVNGNNNAGDGEESLTLTTGTGAVIFNSSVGNIDALEFLDVTSSNSAVTLGGNVTTDGDQNYAGNVTLTNNVTLTTTAASNGNIDFGGTVNGFTGDADGESLTLVADGDVSFAGVVGGIELGGLDVSANAIALGDNVTTSGNQRYDGAVTLNQDLTLETTSNGNITFTSASTVNGNGGGAKDSLTLSTGTGTVTLNGVMGNTDSLASLNVTSADSSVSIGSSAITTEGSQIYSGVVTLTDSAALTSNNGNITFSETVDGDDGTQSLTLSTANGTAIFADAVADLASLTANHAVSLAGNVTTSGNQSYGGAVTLNDSLTLQTTSNGSITFDGTVNGNGNAGDGKEALTLNTGTGAVAFNAAVGNIDSLASLNLASATGSITLGGNVSTVNAQTYGGNVTLDNDVTLQTSNSNISFNGTVNGNSAGDKEALTLTTGSGAVTFSADVGDSDSLEFLNVTSATGSTNLGGNVTTAGAQTYAGTVALDGGITLTGTQVNFTNAVAGDGDDSLSIDAALNLDSSLSGITTLSVSGTSNLAGNVTSSGAQSYTGAVTLDSDVTLQTSDDDITFTSTVNGNGAGDKESLTLTTGTGAVVFGSAVGNTDSLEFVNVTSATGSTQLGGNVTTTGTQTYSGAVTLTDAVALQTTNSAINFGSTLNGSQTFSANAGSGTVTFANTVGNSAALTSLAVTGATIQLGGNVTTSGVQTYTGALSLTGDVDLTTINNNITFSSNLAGNSHSLGIDVGSGNFSYQQLVGLQNLTITEDDILIDKNITTTGSQTYNGEVTLSGARDLDGSLIQFNDIVTGDNTNGLTITGDLNLQGAMTNVASLDVTGESTLAASVTTSGSQTYQDAVAINGSATLTSANSDIIFEDTLDGPGALTLTANNGSINFGGAVGAGSALASLTINADDIDLSHNITTSGSQSYNGVATLGANVSLSTSNSDITFSETLSGSHTLTLNAGSGDVEFGDTVSLTSLTATGDSITLNANVTTSGSQTYNGAVVLNNTLELTTTNSDISINGSVDGLGVGAQSLTFDTGSNGNILVTGAIGATTQLANLDIDNANNSTFNSTISLANNFTQTLGNGTTTLGGAIAADNISLTVNGLTLNNISLNTSATNGNITLNVDDLLTVGGSTTINAGTGTVSLAPSTASNTVHICRDTTCVGSFDTTYDLGDLSITAQTIQFGRNTHSGVITLEGINFDYILQVINNANIVVTGNLDGTNGGALVLNPGAGNALLQGGQVHTQYHQNYNSNVLLSGNFSLLSEEGDITITGDLSSATSGNLTLNTNSDSTGGVGDIVFSGSINNLNDLTIVEAQNVNLGGTVDIDGDFDLQNALGTLTLVDGLELTAANIGLNADTITSTNATPIELTTLNNGDIDLITDHLTISGDLNMEVGTGTITLAPQDSSSHLELCSGASCAGTVGDGAEYDIGSGFTFNAEAQFQVGQTNHTGDITLYGFSASYDLTLANTGAGAITFDGEFDSTHSLTLSSGSGGVIIADNITLGGDLAITADGGTGTITLGAATINTDGAQSYTGAVELAGTTSLVTDNADIDFSSTIDGNESLSINTGTGDVDFNGAVGATTPLASLTVNGGDITFTNITTNGTLSLSAQNTLNFNPGTSLDAGGALTLAVNQAGSAAGVTLDLNGLTLDGSSITLQGSGVDRLQGYDNVANTWAVTGSTSGTLNNASLAVGAGFTGFSELLGGDTGDTFNISGVYNGNLIGGSGNDRFNRTGTGRVTGQINGGAGSNTYDVSGTSSPVTLVFGQGFSNIQTLLGNGDILQGSGSTASNWTLSGNDSGTLGVGASNVSFDGFSHVISGLGGTNTFVSNGQYTGTVEIRGGDNRWHYTAGKKLTQGQVTGSGTLFIPRRDNGTSGNMSVSNSDLFLPSLTSFVGNLFIGGVITPGTLPLNANFSSIAINANQLTLNNVIETGGNLVLLASEIILTGASISSGGDVSFVATGSFCDVCSGLSGSGNVIVQQETLVEAEGGQIIAAGGVTQSDNLILDFNGGAFELAVSQEQQETSQPSGLSNATGVALSANTNAFINRLGLEVVSVAVNFSNPAAAVLGVRAIEVVDLALFEEDLTLFGRMGEGVALAFAQCEEIEGCTPDVTADELTASIDELQQRIDQLESELTTTSDVERREQIQTLLAGFRSQQAEFSTYRSDLQSFTGFEELMDEELGTDQEIDMEAVERQLAVIETIYTRVRFLENLQFNTERREHFADATGLDLSEERLNEIIESTLAVAARAEAQLETLLD